ncbi:hypothetical protein DSECCO2_562930 [anaerobic digester metagenome]
MRFRWHSRYKAERYTNGVDRFFIDKGEEATVSIAQADDDLVTSDWRDGFEEILYNAL